MSFSVISPPLRRFLSLVILLTVVSSAQAKDDIVVVLTSDVGPYKEAFVAFQNALGSSPRVVNLAQDDLKIIGRPRVIMAFGGKAATQKYPSNVCLIYGIAPGTYIPPAAYEGTAVQISMMPEAQATLRRLKELQPELRRMAVFWISQSQELIIKSLRSKGRDLQIDVIAERLDKPEDLPERLRQLKGQVDAIWLPSDPLLVSEQSFVLLSQFSDVSQIPWYSSIAGLVDRGATATVSSSYGDMGRVAAQTVQRVLQDKATSLEIYSEQTELAVNVKTARKIGLTISPEALKRAEKVIQ